MRTKHFVIGNNLFGKICFGNLDIGMLLYISHKNFVLLI